MGLFKILKKNVKLFPNKRALIIDGSEYTFKEFFDLVLQTILNLQKNNFKKNNIITIIEDNTLSHIVSLFALSYIDCTVVPAGTYYSTEHLSRILKLTKCDGIIGPSIYCNLFKKKLKIKKFLSTDYSKKFPYFFSENNKKIFKNKGDNNKKKFIITFSSEFYG